ncbi:MAG: tetratricopeptide repeat protein, partial [Planctomycetota bacterium]
MRLKSSLITLLLSLSALHAVELSDRATRYLDLLSKRPEADSLFDRFLDVALTECAHEELESLLRADCDDPGERLLLARYLMRGGKTDEAISLLDALLQERPEDPVLHQQRALLAAQELQFAVARDHAARAVALTVDSSNTSLLEDALRLQARMAARLGDGDQAIATLRQLLTHFPDEAAVQQDVVELLAAESLYREAASLCRTLVNRASGSHGVQLRLRLVELQQRLGEDQQARDVLASVLAEAAAGSWVEREVLARLEQYFRRQDDLSGLLHTCQQLREQQPHRLALLRLQARVQQDLDQQDEADASWQELLALAPQDQDLRRSHIDHLIAAERYQEACVELEGLIEAQSADVELRFRLAAIRHRAGQDAEAVAELQRIAGSASDPMHRLRAARECARMQDDDNADAIFTALIADVPDDPSILRAHISHLLTSGRAEAGIERARRLVAHQPAQRPVVADLLVVDHPQAAWELLAESPPASGLDQERLLRAGLAAERPRHELLPAARQRMRQLSTPDELSSALTLVLRIVDDGDDPALRSELISELQQADNPGERCLAAALLESDGQPHEADALLADDTPLSVAMGAQLARQRRDDQALVTALRLRLQQEDHQPGILRELIATLRNLGQMAEALEYCHAWQQRSPGNLDAWMSEVDVLCSQNDYEASIVLLRKIVARFPNDTRPVQQLAQATTQAGQHLDAEHCYWRLLDMEEEPEERLRWIEPLARVCLQSGRDLQLIASLEQRCRGNPEAIHPLLALAQAHGVLEQRIQQRQALLRASRLRPEDPQLLRRIAQLAQEDGDDATAIRCLEQAMAGGDNEARQELARLCLERGDEQRALRLLMEHHGDARSREQVAATFLGSGLPDLADELLTEVLQQHPNDARLHYLHGLIQLELYRYQAATTSLLRAWDCPGPVPPTPQVAAPDHALQSSFMQALPADLREVQQLLGHQHQILAHRQRRRGWHMPGLTSSGVHLPADRQELERAVQVLLATIVAESDGDQLEQLAQELTQRGVRHAGIRLEIAGQAPHQLDAGLLRQRFREQPDNALLAALWLHAGAQTRSNVPVERDPDLAARALELLRDHPVLALSACLLLDEEQERIDQGLAVIDEMRQCEPDNGILLYTLANLAVDDAWSQQLNGMQAPPALRAAARDLASDWYMTLLEQPQTAAWWHLLGLRVLAAKEDPTSFLHALDTVCQQAGHQQLGWFRHGQQNALVQALPDPPRLLADVPDFILAMLLPAQPHHQIPYRLEESVVNGLAAHAKDLRHPGLRALLLRLHDTEQFDNDIDGMILRHATNPDLHLLAAARASARDDHATAISHLQTLRRLGLPRGLRLRVDGALLHHADSSEDPAHAAIALASAMRLRGGNLDEVSRERVIAALRAGGHEQQADALTQLPAGSSPRPMQVQSQKDRIDQMLASERMESARNLALRELRQLAEAAMSTQYFDNQAYRMVQICRSLGTHQQLQPCLDALPLNNQRDRILAGRILEAADQADAAIAHYRAGLGHRLYGQAARARLIVLELPDVSAVESLLHELPPRDREQVGRMLARLLAYPHNLQQESMALCRLLPELIASAHAREDLSWCIRVLDGLCSNNSDWQHLFDHRQHDDTDWLQRRGIALRLTGSLLAHASTGAEAFRRLLSLTPPDQRWSQNLIDQALRVCDLPTLSSTTTYHYHHQEFAPSPYDPASYLLSAAHHLGEVERWHTDWLPQVPRAKRPRALEQVYDCAPEAIATASRSLLAASEGSHEPLLDALEQRELLRQSESVLLEALEQAVQQHSWNPPTWLFRWLLALQTLGDEQASDRIMQHLSTCLLGEEPERWQELVDAAPRKRTNSGDITGSIRLLTETMHQLLECDLALAAVFDLIGKVPALCEFNNMAYKLRSWFDEQVEARNWPTLIQAATAAGCFADAARFTTLPIDNFEHGSLLRALLHWADKDEGCTLQLRIALALQPGFGAHLTVALLDQDAERAWQLMEEIQSDDESRQIAVTRLIQNVVGLRGLDKEQQQAVAASLAQEITVRVERQSRMNYNERKALATTMLELAVMDLEAAKQAFQTARRKHDAMHDDLLITISRQAARREHLQLIFELLDDSELAFAWPWTNTYYLRQGISKSADVADIAASDLLLAIAEQRGVRELPAM